MGSPLENEVASRFGVLPNFFRLGSADPKITANLWGFAQFAYLDNPLPSGSPSPRSFTTTEVSIGKALPGYLRRPAVILDHLWALPDLTMHSLGDAENFAVVKGEKIIG